MLKLFWQKGKYCGIILLYIESFLTLIGLIKHWLASTQAESIVGSDPTKADGKKKDSVKE